MKTLEFRHYDSANGGGCRVFINGEKDNSLTAKGCGYDRQGAALGNYIEKYFQDELIKLAEKSEKKARSEYSFEFPEYYGMYETNTKDKRIFLDGACGFSSMERILNAIGYKLIYCSTNLKLSEIYILDKLG